MRKRHLRRSDFESLSAIDAAKTVGRAHRVRGRALRRLSCSGLVDERVDGRRRILTWSKLASAVVERLRVFPWHAVRHWLEVEDHPATKKFRPKFEDRLLKRGTLREGDPSWSAV